jgi:glycosyltransferase involved in cell wall biosynthesis
MFCGELMKKIGVFLGSEPDSGGMFQYSQAVLDAVASLPNSEFLSVVAYASPRWQPYLKSYKLKTFHLGNIGGTFSLCNVWRATGLPIGAWRRISPHFHPVVRTLIREQCDLWIFPSQDAWGYMAPVPSLASIHDLMHRYERRFPEVSANGRYYLRERLFRNICRWAKGILVDSEVGRQQVHESYQVPSERIFVLPYVPPRYITEGVISPDFFQKYQLPTKFIFYPAQFWQHKNHIRLISALAKVKEKHPDISLVLVGTRKNAYEDVVRHVKSLGLDSHVRFFGYVPDNDMPEFYRRARAMVMPTFFGPTNIPPLEAFTLGSPVAISNVYGIPEQVGDAALLFSPSSIDEIADCIERLWSDDALCALLIVRGHARAMAWGQRQFYQSLRQIVDTLID